MIYHSFSRQTNPFRSLIVSDFIEVERIKFFTGKPKISPPIAVRKLVSASLKLTAFGCMKYISTALSLMEPSSSTSTRKQHIIGIISYVEWFDIHARTCNCICIITGCSIPLTGSAIVNHRFDCSTIWNIWNAWIGPQILQIWSNSKSIAR